MLANRRSPRNLNMHALQLCLMPSGTRRQQELTALRARCATDGEALKALRAKMVKDMQERLKLSRENDKLKTENAAFRAGIVPCASRFMV